MNINKEKLLTILNSEYKEQIKSSKKDSKIHEDFNRGYEMGYRHATDWVRDAKD